MNALVDLSMRGYVYIKMFAFFVSFVLRQTIALSFARTSGKDEFS